MLIYKNVLWARAQCINKKYKYINTYEFSIFKYLFHFSAMNFKKKKSSKNYTITIFTI